MEALRKLFFFSVFIITQTFICNAWFHYEQYVTTHRNVCWDIKFFVFYHTSNTHSGMVMVPESSILSDPGKSSLSTFSRPTEATIGKRLAWRQFWSFHPTHHRKAQRMHVGCVRWAFLFILHNRCQTRKIISAGWIGTVKLENGSRASRTKRAAQAQTKGLLLLPKNVLRLRRTVPEWYGIFQFQHTHTHARDLAYVVLVCSAGTMPTLPYTGGKWAEQQPQDQRMNERRLTRQCRTICSPSACRVYRARSVSNCSSLLHSDHVSRCRAPLFPGFNIANAMVSNTSQEATAVRLPPTGRTLCQSNASKSRGSNFALYRHFASTSLGQHANVRLAASLSHLAMAGWSRPASEAQKSTHPTQGAFQKTPKGRKDFHANGGPSLPLIRRDGKGGSGRQVLCRRDGAMRFPSKCARTSRRCHMLARGLRCFRFGDGIPCALVGGLVFTFTFLLFLSPCC